MMYKASALSYVQSSIKLEAYKMYRQANNPWYICQYVISVQLYHPVNILGLFISPSKRSDTTTLNTVWSKAMKLLPTPPVIVKAVMENVQNYLV